MVREQRVRPLAIDDPRGARDVPDRKSAFETVAMFDDEVSRARDHLDFSRVDGLVGVEVGKKPPTPRVDGFGIAIDRSG
jgi:hypothetical protein